MDPWSAGTYTIAGTPKGAGAYRGLTFVQVPVRPWAWVGNGAVPRNRRSPVTPTLPGEPGSGSRVRDEATMRNAALVMTQADAGFFVASPKQTMGGADTCPFAIQVTPPRWDEVRIASLHPEV